MKPVKSVKFNFIMNAILTVSFILFPLITFPYVSRVLNAEGLGKISFIGSITIYFSMIASLGIPTYGIRACAQVRDDKEKLAKTVQEIFFVNMVMTILSYVLLYALIFSVDRLRNEYMLAMISSASIFFNLLGMDWVYRALEEYRYITIRSLFFKIISIILMFLLVKQPEDYLIYSAINVFAGTASNILNFINVRKHVDIYKVRSGYNIKKHIKPILVMFALTAATTVYTNLDNIILGFLHNDAAVGYYNAAGKVKGILLGLVTSLGAVLLPRLSYYVEIGEKERFIELSNKAFHFIIIISLSLTVYFIMFSKEAIVFLAGESYVESVLPMQIILPTVIIIGISNLFGLQILLPLGKENLVLYSVTIGAIFNFILNMLLTSKLSYTGTAISNLLAEFIVLLVQVYYIKDLIRYIVKDIKYHLIILAAVLSAVLSYFTKSVFESYFFTLVLSSIVYFGTFYLFLRILKNTFILEVEEQLLSYIINKFKRN